MSGIGTQDEFKVISVAVYKGTTVEIIDGDLLRYPVKVIVNAANVGLRGGGGIDGAIHSAAGPELLRELKALLPNNGEVGGAYGPTHSHNIEACQYIIHAVGPNWNIREQRDAALLGNAYRNSLDLAAKNNLRSIAFPAISVGIFAMPKGVAGPEILRTIRTWIDNHEGVMDRISILLKGFSLQDIKEMQFEWIAVYIPDRGVDMSGEPPAAFRRPIKRPVSTTSTTSTKPTTSTAGPKQPLKTTTKSPVVDDFIAGLQIGGAIEGTPDPPDTSPESAPGPPPRPPPRSSKAEAQQPPSDSDEEPPYLFNYYEPLSHMWMGRDRYYALLEAGIDPSTFTEGMNIPNPEDDPDDESLPSEEEIAFQQYHQERVDRGEAVSKYLDVLKDLEEEEAALKAKVAEQVARIAEEEDSKVALENAGKIVRCGVSIKGVRCHVMCNPKTLHLRKIPGRCLIHQGERFFSS